MSDPTEHGLIGNGSSLSRGWKSFRPSETVTIECPNCGEGLKVPVTFEDGSNTPVISNKRELVKHLARCFLRGSLGRRG